MRFFPSSIPCGNTRVIVLFSASVGSPKSRWTVCLERIYFALSFRSRYILILRNEKKSDLAFLCDCPLKFCYKALCLLKVGSQPLPRTPSPSARPGSGKAREPRLALPASSPRLGGARRLFSQKQPPQTTPTRKAFRFFAWGWGCGGTVRPRLISRRCRAAHLALRSLGTDAAVQTHMSRTRRGSHTFPAA